MMETTPEGVAAKVMDRLKRVKIADGYETDIGTKVFDGRISVTPEDCPCSTLVEADDEVEHDGRMPSYNTRQKFLLIGYDICERDLPNKKGHAIVRDLKKALFRYPDGKYDSNLERAVRVVNYNGKDMAPRADGSPMIVAAIEIIVQYAENMA